MNKKTASINNPLLICSLTLILCATLFVSFKKLYSGDEIASFLFATAHSNEYQDSTILSLQNEQNITAARLKIFYKTDPDWSFGEISKDIGTNDWHPPLYFYLLGQTVKLWGTNLYASVWLNLTFKLVALFFLYQIALLFFKEKKHAFITLFIWSLSHANTYIMFEARQYDLLCALMLGHLYFFIRWTNGAHWLNLVIAVVFTVGGYLTHYTFLPVSTGLLVAAFITSYPNSLKKSAAAIVILLFSGILFIVIHPYFLQSLAILKHKGLTVSVSGILFRLSKSVLSLVDFIIPVFELKIYFYKILEPMNTEGLISFLFVLILATLIAVFYFGRKAKQYFKSVTYHRPTTDQLFVGVYMVWLMGALFGSYLCFQAPQHAMGRKYLAMFFPFFALSITYLISLTTKEKFWFTSLSVTLCIGMFMRTLSEYSYQEKLGEVNLLASKQHTLYTTSFDRRGFARLIPDLQNDAMVVYLEKEKLARDTFSFTKEGMVLSSTPLNESIQQQRHLKSSLFYSSVDSNSFFFYTVE